MGFIGRMWRAIVARLRGTGAGHGLPAGDAELTRARESLDAAQDALLKIQTAVARTEQRIDRHRVRATWLAAQIRTQQGAGNDKIAFNLAVELAELQVECDSLESQLGDGQRAFDDGLTRFRRGLRELDVVREELHTSRAALQLERSLAAFAEARVDPDLDDSGQPFIGQTLRDLEEETYLARGRRRVAEQPAGEDAVAESVEERARALLKGLTAAEPSESSIQRASGENRTEFDVPGVDPD